VAALGGTVAWSLPAYSQTPKVLRLGIVTTTIPRTAPQYVTLMARLRELGHVEGQNLVLDFVNLDGHVENFPQAMKDLVARKADILIAFGNEFALKAAMAATSTVPIVMLAIDFDPLAQGYIKGLARPGGNVTGVFLQQVELAAKRVELAKQAFPDLKAAAMVWDEISAPQWQASEKAAPPLGLDLLGIKMAQQPYDYDQALAAVPMDHRRFLIVANSAGFFYDRTRLGNFTLEHRLPSICPAREFAEAGGLISYGADFLGSVRRLADYVDSIARGAKAADLPVEQPTKFELVINLKTAKTFGIAIPSTILARADDVIE
jgi:putative ABC transport system substrate-binding protein